MEPWIFWLNLGFFSPSHCWMEYGVIGSMRRMEKCPDLDAYTFYEAMKIICLVKLHECIIFAMKPHIVIATPSDLIVEIFGSTSLNARFWIGGIISWPSKYPINDFNQKKEVHSNCMRCTLDYFFFALSALHLRMQWIIAITNISTLLFIAWITPNEINEQFQTQNMWKTTNCVGGLFFRGWPEKFVGQIMAE